MKNAPARLAVTLGSWIAAALLLPPAAEASTLFYSNIDSTSDLAAPSNPAAAELTVARGVTFTVGSAPITLQVITFGFYCEAAGTIDVQFNLYAGSDATGAILRQQTISNIGVSNGLNLAVMPLSVSGDFWSLDANAQYTVAVLSSPGLIQPVQASASVTNLPSSSWTATGLTFNRFTAGASAATDDYAMRLSGVFTPVPGAGLAGIATLGFARSRRRR